MIKLDQIQIQWLTSWSSPGSRTQGDEKELPWRISPSSPWIVADFGGLGSQISDKQTNNFHLTSEQELGSHLSHFHHFHDV